MVDPYVYPGTSVLCNLAGLQDADALAENEAQASTLRLAVHSAPTSTSPYLHCLCSPFEASERALGSASDGFSGSSLR